MLRTDLALEAKEMYHENAGVVTEIEGVRAKTEDLGDLKITTVEILNERGKQALHKEIGVYITIEMPKFKEFGQAFFALGSQTLRNVLLKLLKIPYGSDVLVVGLGNRHITPDALGCRVTDRIIVTKHLHKLAPETVKNMGAVSCLAPGVMGITGLETADIVRSVLKSAKPKAIIAVDALAARSTERIGTTIQLSDTGISPGSGIGNMRTALCEKSLGIPVIAIGVPMVVDAATLAYDAIVAISAEKPSFSEVKRAVSKSVGNLLVTPKDVDRITTHMANVVSAGINLALHNISLTEMQDYIG